jgi:hypothetical protein
MHREGNYEEYKSYNITKEMEAGWYKELIDACSDELSIRDWHAVLSLESIAKNYQASIILENVILFVSRHLMGADSIVKLMYAEIVISIIKSTMKVVSKDLFYQACKATFQILEDVISKPLIIDPGHDLHNYQLKDKRSLNNRAKQSIEEIKKLLERM